MEKRPRGVRGKARRCRAGSSRLSSAMMYPKSMSARKSAVKKVKRKADAPYVCWLCGQNGCADPLDGHHIFGGAFRKKSEQYGLKVYLCHGRCHENGKEAVHQNADTMQQLHEYGQRKAMAENDWTTEDFIREFGKNYV